MTGTTAPLVERLLEPSRRLGPEDLAAQWFHQDLRLRIPGYGELADRPGVLNKVRGALGRALMESASAEAVAGQPCPWSPPCALDVFFREQVRLGRHGLPKPLVLAADRSRRDLVLTCRVFGFACDWSGILLDRLVAVVRQTVEWGRAAPDLALNRPEVARATLGTREGLDPGEAPDAVTLRFLMPVDATGTDPLDEPWSLIGRLARRIDGLARWQDAALDMDWGALDAHWRGLDYDTSGLRRVSLDRHMGRAKVDVKAPTLAGSLGIAGDLRPVWPLLALGRTCHLGRGAVQGLGRYRIEAG